MLPFRNPFYASSNLANLHFPKKPTSVLRPTSPLESPAVNFTGIEVSAPEIDPDADEEKPVLPGGIIQFYEEDINDYCVGGYHPVQIGDIFNNKYKVMRKLGFGKFSTIWLALDTSQQRPIALKIIKADSSGIEKDVYEQESLRYIKSGSPDSLLGLHDHFVHKGPNGDHVCLVFNSLGPEPNKIVQDGGDLLNLL